MFARYLGLCLPVAVISFLLGGWWETEGGLDSERGLGAASSAGLCVNLHHLQAAWCVMPGSEGGLNSGVRLRSGVRHTQSLSPWCCACGCLSPTCSSRTTSLCPVLTISVVLAFLPHSIRTPHFPPRVLESDGLPGLRVPTHSPLLVSFPAFCKPPQFCHLLQVPWDPLSSLKFLQAVC